MIFKQFDTHIKTFRSDNAKELQFVKYFKLHGVLHQFSCVERPQQNSVVERKHQLLLNVARALFYQSHIPSVYWSECVSTAAFLINRTPTKSLGNISPYLKLYKEQPQYSQLRTFGCMAFASTLLSKRQKFHPRARACVFIGYPQGMKGYRLLDIETKQIFVSRDAVFHEEIYPFQLSKHKSDQNPFISHALREPIFVDSLSFDSQIPITQTNPQDDFDQNEPPIQQNETQRPQRQRSRPTYLRDYHCNMVTSISAQKSPKYPLSDVLSYDQL